MMFLLMVPVVMVLAVAYRILQLYAPSNLIVAHVRRHPPRLWVAGALLMLAVLLLLTSAVCSSWATRGGTGWLHVLFLVTAWDAFKFAFLAVAVVLRRARMAFGVAIHWGRSMATD